MKHFLRARASGIAEFADCPERWAAKTLRGEHTPAGIPAAIGTAVHRSTAEFDASRLESEARWLSIDDTADIIVESLKDPDLEVVWGGMPMHKAVAIGIGVHVRYCNEIAPLQMYTQVELTLKEKPVLITLENGDEVEITLTGTLDRIREDANEYYRDDGTPAFNVRYGITDVKSGGRAISQPASRHKAQLGVYELLAEETLGSLMTLPGQICALQTSSNFQAELKEVENCRDVLVGNAHQKGLLYHMASMFVSGDFFGNASSWLCSEKFCPAYDYCMFR